MADKGVEKTATGVKKTGNWSDIAEFGKRLESTLEKLSISESSISKFSEWRPRLEEAEADVKKKTVEAATLSQQKVEEKSEGVKEHFGEASDKVVEASEQVKNGNTPEKEIAGASKKAAIPVVSNIFKFIRRIEGYIYSVFMMKFNSFYLDTGELSVNVSNQRDGDYSMNVKVSGKENRGALQKEFEEEE